MKLPWLMISILGWIFLFWYSSIPAETWYDLRSVSVTDIYEDPEDPSSRKLIVSRSINRPFRGWYEVEEQLHVTEDTWLTTASCKNKSPVNYRSDAALPEHLTVGWWTWGECESYPRVFIDNPDSKTYRLCTWVSIEVIPDFQFLRKTLGPVCSNTYKGRALPN